MVRFGRGNAHCTAGTFPARYSLFFSTPSLRSIVLGSEGVDTGALGVGEGVGVGVGVATTDGAASTATGVVDCPHAPVTTTASTATTTSPVDFAVPGIN